MKPLSPSALALASLAGLVLGSSISALLVSSGQPFPVSLPTFLVTMPGLGALTLALTIPIIRYRQNLEKYESSQIKKRPDRINPFYAFRVLVWSRAAALAGAGFLGWHLGQLLYIFAFNLPSSGVSLPTGLGAAASAILVVASWFAERNCRTPEDPGGNQKAGSAQ